VEFFVQVSSLVSIVSGHGVQQYNSTAQFELKKETPASGDSKGVDATQTSVIRRKDSQLTLVLGPESTAYTRAQNFTGGPSSEISHTVRSGTASVSRYGLISVRISQTICSTETADSKL
jgi:hypothetical protein